MKPMRKPRPQRATPPEKTGEFVRHGPNHSHHLLNLLLAKIFGLGVVEI